MTDLWKCSLQVIVLSYFLFFATGVTAQIDHPKASPKSVLTQVVGLTNISIEYSRPSARGREVVGGLVPFGRIWRVGANESTKITFDQDVEINGKPLIKGQYALYAIPQKEAWTMIIHKNTAHWGDGRDKYNEDEDALRFQVVPKETNLFTETFSIDFQNITHTEATLVLDWENTQVSFQVGVFTDKLVMQNIYKQIEENSTATTYYQSARYLQEQGKMQHEALEWLEKAQGLTGDKYYIHRVKSLVQSQLKDYAAAIVSAEKSLELAGAQNKDEFVRMNQKNIDLWREKLDERDN